MRQHTVAGERILGATECMRPVARLVRAAHERWDGLGYPDGLARRGDPARRPHHLRLRRLRRDAQRRALQGADVARATRSPSCAAAPGTQFDPRVVEVLAKP